MKYCNKKRCMCCERHSKLNQALKKELEDYKQKFRKEAILSLKAIGCLRKELEDYKKALNIYKGFIKIFKKPLTTEEVRYLAYALSKKRKQKLKEKPK